MPAGSFWTQPKGALHITAVSGSDVLAYIEIDEGPYLVYPPEEEFPTDQAPINVDASNLVWVNLPGPLDSAGGAEQAFLWGKPGTGQWSGRFLKLPAGFRGVIRSHGAVFGAVVVQGSLTHGAGAGSERSDLRLGGFFSAEGAALHEVSCARSQDCILYVRTDGAVDVSQNSQAD